MRTSLTSPSTALAIITLAVLTPFTEADIKLDLAIIADRGATLGDCEYSLLHEPSLGSQHKTAYKSQGRRAICTNDKGSGGDSSLIGWHQSQCVERIDVYYEDAHVPDTHQVFWNSHGVCQYRAYSQNAGGWANGFESCFCDTVGLPGNC